MSKARKDEAEAVRTTIVGGRPPGSGRNNVPVPRGIEVLVKKASVDAEFRELLLKQRGKAAAAIQLDLDPAEDAMISAIPQEQLARTVDQTTVPMELKSAFQGRVALVMLAALGASLTACGPAQPPGAQPNPSNAIPPQAQPANPSSYTSPPMTVAGAVPLPDKTNTNVPPPNVENTNPPPPHEFFIISGINMHVPPSPATNAPATNPPPTNPPITEATSTNPPPPQQPLQFESAGLRMGVPPTPPPNAPATNPPPTNPPPNNPPPNNRPTIIAGLMVRPPANPPTINLPITNPPITEATPTNPPTVEIWSVVIHGLP